MRSGSGGGLRKMLASICYATEGLALHLSVSLPADVSCDWVVSVGLDPWTRPRLVRRLRPDGKVGIRSKTSDEPRAPAEA